MRTQSINLALAIVLVCPFASAQWVHTSLPDIDILCLAVSGTNLFAGTSGGGVFRSTDNGTNWTAVKTGLTDTIVYTLAVSGTNLFAGTSGGGVFLSTNGGTSWSQAGLKNEYGIVSALALSGTNLFAYISYNDEFTPHVSGLRRSTDSGATWDTVYTGLGGGINTFAVSGTNIFAGASPADVYLSTNNGSTWVAMGLASLVSSNNNVQTIAISGKRLFAGIAGSHRWWHGVCLSTDNGTTWDTTSLCNISVSSLTVSGTNIFASSARQWNVDTQQYNGGGVFLSTNNGTSWTMVGFTDTSVWSLAVSGLNLFAWTDVGVWRRPLSEMITSVSFPSTELPTQWSLEQNYPNPFNPSTTIKYELPKTSHVSLSVYDILGREVSVLMNERRDAGVYEVKFDGSRLASGVYFYRIQAGEYVATKKLLLMK